MRKGTSFVYERRVCVRTTCLCTNDVFVYERASGVREGPLFVYERGGRVREGPSLVCERALVATLRLLRWRFGRVRWWVVRHAGQRLIAVGSAAARACDRMVVVLEAAGVAVAGGLAGFQGFRRGPVVSAGGCVCRRGVRALGGSCRLEYQRRSAAGAGPEQPGAE